MSFFNEVEYEAKKTLPDGVEVIVKAKASETSSISFEDAWLKAQELAKKNAEAKLAELIKKIEEKDKTTEVIIKGMKGDIGYSGSRGRTGATGPTGSAGKDLTNPTTVITTQLTLTKEATQILNNLITLSSSTSRSLISGSPINTNTINELTSALTTILNPEIGTYNSDTNTTSISGSTALGNQLSQWLTTNQPSLESAIEYGFVEVKRSESKALSRDGTESDIDQVIIRLLFIFLGFQMAKP